METEEKLEKNQAGVNWSVVFAGIVLVLCLSTLWVSFRSPLSGAIQKREPVFGLLIGTDLVDYARHADTIVLVRYDPSARSLDLLSIPRDTKIKFPDVDVNRINEIYAYAFRVSRRNHEYASKELTKAVQWMLFSSTMAPSGSKSSGDTEYKYFSSENDTVPNIHFYAHFDYEGFKKIIDQLGGIPVTVDEPMHYDDYWGKLHIHFEPGKLILNGQKSLEFVRYRGRSGDYGRITRQQEFLLNVLSAFKKPDNIVKFPKLIWLSLSSIYTNLNWLELSLIAWELKDIPRENIRLLQLPGKVHRSYWIPNPEGMKATAELLVKRKKSLSQFEVENKAASLSHESDQELEERANTTVEVWNASNQKGLALDVVNKLRGSGFDVVKWGNYESRQRRTLVRDRRGITKQASAIRNLLNTSRIEVITRVESDPLVDIEVILGGDYGR